jgi:hypothetical protein
MILRGLYETHVIILQFCTNPYDIRTLVTFYSEVFRFDAEQRFDDG